MRICKECNEKISYSNIIKNINLDGGLIKCTKCNAKYKISKPKLRYAVSILNLGITLGLTNTLGFDSFIHIVINLGISIFIYVLLELVASRLFKYTKVEN